MIKRLSTHRLLIQLWCTTAICAIAATGQSSRPAPRSPVSGVLPLIERYKAPPFPKSSYVKHETYDYRIQARRPVPATLTDVFVCDIWQRVSMDLKLKISPPEVSEEIVKQAINVYLEKGWSDIAGYRPWTHWNFIRKLKAPQRDVLSRKIAAYISRNGVRDVQDATDKK